MDLTGMEVAVELTVEVDAATVWDAVADVPRIGEWSPECRHAQWADEDGGPRPGARFTGHNELGEFTWTAIGEIIEANRPASLSWVMLDRSGLVSAPSSRWRYDLTALDAGRTLIRHHFQHGPGRSGVTLAIRTDPTRADQIVADRRAQLRDNMLATLARVRDTLG